MSEYWKSTPKYWCKYCSVYVRDTKLERSNHEATAKHQGGLKRFLRDLHRDHEKDQREKDRVKREIERLNGVVGTSAGGSSSSAPGGARAPPPAPAPATEAQRKKQLEQLADMGIEIPTELRGDLAMASEWTVTNTRIIDDTPKTDDNGNVKVEAVATGVRKRQKDEDEEEEEEAMKGLFKKPRKWGRDTKQAPEEDDELDALLNGSLTQLKPTKKEEPQDTPEDATKKVNDDGPVVKKEPSDDEPAGIDAVKLKSESKDPNPVKTEDGVEPQFDLRAVVFKKRKPKNIRQK